MDRGSSGVSPFDLLYSCTTVHSGNLCIISVADADSASSRSLNIPVLLEEKGEETKDRAMHYAHYASNTAS